MKKIGMITGQFFRLQLSGQIILHLVENGFIADDEQAEEAMYFLARLFAKGIELEDFTYQFNVTDKDNKRKYIA